MKMIRQIKFLKGEKMITTKYPNLLSSIQIGNQLFRNRYFAAPIGYPYHTSKEYPEDQAFAWFERKAMGGAATVNIGSLIPDNDRGVVGPMMRLDDPTALPAHHRLTRMITRHGAVAVAELMHAGANSYYSKLVLNNEIYGAVDTVNALGMEIPQMPEDIILDTIEKYAEAAAFAKWCGYGMITVHAGHGWMLNEFLSKKNNRKDKWGGSIENNCRFVNAIIDRIHQKCGKGFPVDVRISGSECYEGGYDIEYGIEVAKQLEGHADIINVSCGAHEKQEVFTLTHPSMFLSEGANVKFAAEIKKHLKNTPVAAVGAMSEPEFMEDVIASGKADIVMVARGLIADPDAPLKIRTGNADNVRKCLRCFECFSHNSGKIQMACAINPEIGLERETSIIPPLKVKKRILVAGGGIAGMQAAITAKERGHDVILCEKSPLLGGILCCENKVPFKKHLGDYINQQKKLLNNLGVEIHTNTEVTPSLCEKLNPDVIIAALGAAPKRLNIPGIEKNKAVNIIEAYNNVEALGNNIAVIGGGLAGMELAIYLSNLGKKVKILELSNKLNDSGNIIHGLALNNELKRCNVEVHTSVQACEINEDGIIGEFVGDKYSIPDSPIVKASMQTSCCFGVTISDDVEIGTKKLYTADTIVFATGLAPLRKEAEALRFCANEFYQIGDCLIPKNILEATSSAYTIARDIGSKL